MTDRMFDVPVDRQRLAEIIYAHAFGGSSSGRGDGTDMRCHACDEWLTRPAGVKNFKQHEAIHQAEMIGKALEGE